MQISFYLSTLFLFLSLLSGPEKSAFRVPANELRVAVSSNFVTTIRQIISRFEETSGHSVQVISGSSGKHYAQIRQGAPYDLFFSADIIRPKLLESEGIAVPGSRFTYAIGKLVLWSPNQDLVDSAGTALNEMTDIRLSIANPRLAPYGQAAKEILQARSLWSSNSDKIVRGENINQALHFVESGNADLGFVAYSQITNTDRITEGSYWIVPQELYTPIEQQAVMLVDTDAARQFLTFFKSEEIKEFLAASGYETP